MIHAASSAEGFRKRLQLGFGLLSVCLAFVVAGKSITSYQYSHVPLHSAIVARPYPQIGQSASSLVFSPGGQTLAVTDEQSGISFWSIPQLHCDRRFDILRLEDLATMHWLSDGGGTLIGGGSSVLQKWDVSGGKFVPLILNLAQGTKVSVPLMPERTDFYSYHAISQSWKLAAGADGAGEVAVWDLHTGRRLFLIPMLPMGVNGYPTDFCDVALSPDDKLMATTSMFGDASVPNAPIDIVIHNARTGVIVRKWQWKDSVMFKSTSNLSQTGLTFSADSTSLATANDYKVVIWNVFSEQREHTLNAKSNSVFG